MVPRDNSGAFPLFSFRSSYDNGQWYNLSFAISGNQTILSVTHTGTEIDDTRSVQLPDAFSLQGGARMVIGGRRVSFAGDIKNLGLSSDKTASQGLILRDLVGSHWIKDDGVSYEGIIKGDVRQYELLFYLMYDESCQFESVNYLVALNRYLCP